MSRLFTPTDQACSVNVSCTGTQGDTVTNECAPTGLPDRAIGRAILSITATLAVDADSDGVGHSGFARARLEYKSTAGGVWTTVPGTEITASAIGLSATDSDTGGSPASFDLDVAINNLTQIGVRAYGNCSSNGGTGFGHAVATITAWSIVVNLKTGGILGA